MTEKDFKPLITILRTMIENAMDNPPEGNLAAAGGLANPCSDGTMQAYEEQNLRHTGLKKVLVRIADSLYMKNSDGEILHTDYEQYYEQYQREDTTATTPFGAVASHVADGIVCGLILKDAYEFGWCNNLDSFLKERIEQMRDFCDMTVDTHPTERDPVIDRIFAVLSEMTGYVRVHYDPEVHDLAVQHPFLQDKDDLMERWARLAGVRR